MCAIGLALFTLPIAETVNCKIRIEIDYAYCSKAWGTASINKVGVARLINQT
jgi:hypothetical protein